MSKALLPFYAIYVGDGSTTNFVLDVSKDPFYFENDTAFGSPGETRPAFASISPNFDHKLSPTNVFNLQAHNTANGTDYGPVSATLDQYQISLTLTTAPPNGTKFDVQGFIEY